MIKSDDIAQIDSDLLMLISNEMAWMYRSIPFSKKNDELTLLNDCKDTDKLKRELSIVLNTSVNFQYVDSVLIDIALSKYYRKSDLISERDPSYKSEFVKDLILEAKSLESSDIHFENVEEYARIRLRIDGKLIERYRINKSSYPALINKIKIMAGMNISEKRMPQDGRFQIKEKDTSIDLRVSTTPTILGEKIVLRILNKDSNKLFLNQIGMHEDQIAYFRKALKNQSGIILISGPTGSGKTSTLYSCLNELNTGLNNILTIEDPVEYTLDGINQVQLKESIGLNFSQTLRSFLRQDPDIIMVGEIRDNDTAQMAIRAAMTGHLVLSTIHTNSAWSTIARLRDMGIPSFLLANTIRISIAQRLIRLLCEECKNKVNSIDLDLPDKMIDSLADHKIYTSRGCNNCFHTGYKGRKAIFEIIPIEKSLQNQIRNQNNNEHEILKVAKISSLAEEAFELFNSGRTSLEEIYPILQDQLN